MNPLELELPDVRIQCGECPRIAFETALVLVFLQEPCGRFPKSPRRARTKEVRRAELLDPPGQNDHRFFELACASAFANACSEDVFVDVPDRTSQGEAGRFTVCHDSLLSV